MNKKNNGIDPKAIVLDSDGRFELNEPQLANISGGMKPRTVTVIDGSTGKCKKETDLNCPGGTIEVIRGTHCACM